MYAFGHLGEFRDRSQELDALEDWWAHDDLPVMVLYGRRRTGKSWLFRRFADGKDAIIFVCDRRSEGAQISKFAETLEPVLEFRPALSTMTDLFRIVHGLRGKRLVVIDEFPELFSGRHKHPDSELMAVLEEVSGTTETKVLLCGSQISTMQNLLTSRAPLHGRARSLQLRGFPFPVARGFLASHHGSDLLERYSIAGGMPRYLNLFDRQSPLRQLICGLLLTQNGPLFDEPRTILEMELVETGVYFSLLETLATTKEMDWGSLLAKSGVDAGTASKYMRVLRDLDIVDAATPAFSSAAGRRRRYRVKDPLIRFWFRFVFPLQEALASDLEPETHFRRNVEPYLSEHVAISFEDVCRSWVAREYQSTTDSVASWWGNALNKFRQQGSRSSEEIDVVGMHGGAATVLGEAKWTRARMPKSVLDDLRTFKIPALEQSGIDVSSASIALFSRSGFMPDLAREASSSNVRLVNLASVLGDAGSESVPSTLTPAL